MKSKLLKYYLLSGFLISFSAYGQKTYQGFPSLVWPKLYDVKFEKSKDGSEDYEKPIFSEAAKSLDGKTISLPGFMVPFESGARSKHFMVSSLPLNACFFCGVGGPETVVEVFARNPVAFTEKPIEIQGVLKLNDRDPEKMMYVLENATVIGEVGF